MTSKIFIGGGGDIQETFDFDKFFFSTLKKEKKILYIATAMANTTAKKEACFDWFSSLVSRHTLDNSEIDFTMWDEKLETTNFTNYSGVYVGGGNTYRLLQVLKNVDILNALNLYIASGSIYYGGSAGGIILGKSILTVSEEKIENVDDEGLNILNGLSVFPHFQNSDSQKEKIIRLCNVYSLKIVAIPEDCGLFVEDGVISVFGKVTVYENEKEAIFYTSGQIIR